jgi:hypothetical protein
MLQFEKRLNEFKFLKSVLMIPLINGKSTISRKLSMTDLLPDAHKCEISNSGYFCTSPGFLNAIKRSLTAI